MKQARETTSVRDHRPPHGVDRRTIESHNVAETLALGQRLGEVLAPGAVVALVGGLGSGKTHFVKGVARGNGTPPDVVVNSPTFVLVNEYPGRLTLFHVDAYRVGGAADLESIGLDEMLDAGSTADRSTAVLVEWADRAGGCLPSDHIRIEIEITGEQDRRFTFSVGGPASRKALASLTCCRPVHAHGAGGRAPDSIPPSDPPPFDPLPSGPPPPRIRDWLQGWLVRHRHPANRMLHGVGIPLLLVALGVGAWQLWMWRWDLWWRPASLLAVSYLLQAVGHAIEGNDMGEVILLKRLVGRPYTAVAPEAMANPPKTRELTRHQH